MKGITSIFLYLSLATCFASPEGLSPIQKEVFHSAANNLRCPSCTGLSILQSEASFSIQIRDMVVKLVKEGKNEQEIINFFTERYGLWILRKPPTRGFHWLAWLGPLCIMALGVFILWSLFWKPKQKQSN